MIVSKTYFSMEAAEVYAARLGVTASYGSHLQIANFANEVLAQLTQRGLPPPSSILVHASFFERYAKKAQSVAAMAENAVLFVNPGAVVWSNPVTTTAALYQARAWSTPHPLHVFYTACVLS